MAIPYNDNLSLQMFYQNPNWYEKIETLPLTVNQSIFKQTIAEVLNLSYRPPFRSVQFLKDLARLIFKVPIRAIATPVFLKQNWKERKRALVNVKLPCYALAQLALMPVKFLFALMALGISGPFPKKARWILEKSKQWTVWLDGRSSQLEALKEEGIKKTKNRQEYYNYFTWLYKIEPSFCIK